MSADACSSQTPPGSPINAAGSTPIRRPQFRGIHHLRIPVSDVTASTDWYTEVLGLSALLIDEEENEVVGAVLSVDDGPAIGLHHDPSRAMLSPNSAWWQWQLITPEPCHGGTHGSKAEPKSNHRLRHGGPTLNGPASSPSLPIRFHRNRMGRWLTFVEQLGQRVMTTLSAPVSEARPKTSYASSIWSSPKW